MEIKCLELMKLAYAPHDKGTCNEIGDMGENLIGEIFDENGIIYHMTGYDCPIDFVVPTQTEVLGIEVKTSLTDYGWVILVFNKKDRDVKKWYCTSNNYSPITVLIKRKDPENGVFEVLWKRGIKRFQVDLMWDFNTFLEAYRAPVLQLKDGRGKIPRTARCASCGRFSRSYETKKMMRFKIPGVGNRKLEHIIYQCSQCIGPEGLWREVG